MIETNLGDGPVWEDAEYDDEHVEDGIPHLDVVEYRNEREYKLHIIELLKAYDWAVETEVSDDSCEGRIDIVASHPAVGTIAVAVKRTHNFAGRNVGEGIAQIQNYRSLTYRDHNIDYWLLAPGFDATKGPDGRTSKSRKQMRNMIRRTIVELKMGMLSRQREALVFARPWDLSIPLRDPDSVSDARLKQIDETIASRNLKVSEYDPRE
jgi:hypothetical protein